MMITAIIFALVLAAQSEPPTGVKLVQLPNREGLVWMPRWYDPAITAKALQDDAGAVAWTVTAGALPPGMTLTAGGQLVGTPTKAGTYTFTVRHGSGVTQAFTISIQPGRSIGPPPPPGEVGAQYTHQFSLVTIQEQ